MRNLTAKLRALAALIVLLTLVVGIPFGLAGLIGNPMHGWADLKVGDLTNEVIIDLLAAVVWLAWAQFALSVVVEFGTATRHVQRPTRIPLVPRASQNLAHSLIGAVLLIGTATVALATPVHALAATPHRAPMVSASVQARTLAADTPTSSTRTGAHEVTSHTGDGGQSAHAATAQPTRSATTPQTVTYLVPSDGHGPDTYWDIAEARLGGGQHWTQIWDLNRGRTQPDGEVMTNPGVLKAGWTVLLPSTAGSGSHVDAVIVHEGDTLSGIAAARGASDWHATWEASKGLAEPRGAHLTDPNLIKPGWTVKVPTAGQTQPTHTTPTLPPRHQTPTQPPVHPPTHQPPDEHPGQTQHPGQTHTPAPTRVPAHQDAPAAARGEHNSSEAPMVAFAGGGVLLAGVSLAALIRHRRRQFRWRHPGRTITSSPPPLQRVERSLLCTGSAGMGDVTWLNEALRSLVHSLAATEDGRLPDVVAARMTSERLELILTGAHPNPPAPWTVDESGTRWSTRREDDLGYDPEARAYHFAPFPTLASVGYTASGEQWLLDLERVAALSLSGEPERCLNLARFLAAELAHNSWSEMLEVTLVGFGREMAEINPERLTYTEDFTQAIAALSRDLESVGQSLGATGTDVLNGRLHNIVGDEWAPHVLLIAPAAAQDTDGLEELLDAMRAQRSRTAVALVLADDPDHADATRWQLTIDEHGVLRIPALGVELIAQQIPAEEAAQLAQMLALAATTEDRPVPPAQSDKPWDAYADAAGALRHAFATAVADRGGASSPDIQDEVQDDVEQSANRGAQVPIGLERSAPGGAADIPALHLAEAAPWMNNSVLPLSPQTYLDHTATTAEDLDALAPAVDEDTRRQVEGLDPELDRDLAAWHDPACTRPKVTLLGKVTVVARGSLPQVRPRVLWNTEVVAYLATRSSGVTTERYGTDLWPDDPDIASKTKVRQSITVVRQWLGTNDRTGQPHLPKSPIVGQISSYRVEDVLVDAELFRRLRLRGLARGADGIADLRAALDLVTGVPFSNRRPDGYGWLAENPLGHIYAGMIVDVAHIVATHHLAAGEPGLAVTAAQVALCSGSSEDVPLLDLVAACDAQDNRAEADAYVKRILANHDAEVEEDLPPRTAEVLLRRQWLGHAS